MENNSENLMLHSQLRYSETQLRVVTARVCSRVRMQSLQAAQPGRGPLVSPTPVLWHTPVFKQEL